MVVYKITNIVNGKYYIGKTTNNLKFRWAVHVSRARGGNTTHFSNAIRKYGVESFNLDVLETASEDSKLLELEMFWIKKLESHNSLIGYNETMGGESGIPTLETKIKISRANIGKTRSPEVKAKWSATRKGKASLLKGRTFPNCRGVSTSAIRQLRSIGFSIKKIGEILYCGRGTVNNRLKGWLSFTTSITH